MKRSFGLGALAIVQLAIAAAPQIAGAQASAPSRCGVGPPASEGRGYVPLPRGDVFCPLVADPKGLRSFVSYLRGTADDLDTDIGSVGISDSFGLLRFGGPDAGEGLQLSLTGSVFAQFDLNTSSFDLLNADYIIALPLTVRRGWFSARARLYHQSSHLGDEFLLNADEPRPERENVSFESSELIISIDAGPLRVYGGGEYLFRRSPEDLERTVAHAGAELRQGAPLLRFGSVAGLRLLAAYDAKFSDEQDWEPGMSVRAGFEVSRPRDSDPPGRRWGLFFEWYDGPSPYGQFYSDDIRYYGVGLHFTL